jgi:hypothetical protein
VAVSSSNNSNSSSKTHSVINDSEAVVADHLAVIKLAVLP